MADQTNGAASAASTQVRRGRHGGAPAPMSVGQRIVATVREVVLVVIMAALISFVIKTWLVQAFYIPSESMEDTLVKNDRVIVSKLTPGPFDLERGDVVVFEDPKVPSPWLGQSVAGEPSTTQRVLTFIGLLPDDAKNHLIKRVIGLPGDHVQADGTGSIKVNGVALTEFYVKAGDDPSTRPFDITVPAGRIWVMGDHRSDSSDSRFHDDGTGRTGSVPIDVVTGRAIALVWPLGRMTWLGHQDDVFAKVPNAGLTTTPGS
ncbi:MAG TPA: signal peptidase I [Candidatus Lustribacter sp.]|nr:signal peptidase I [Candidatus Lustribacter sp.]